MRFSTYTAISRRRNSAAAGRRKGRVSLSDQPDESSKRRRCGDTGASSDNQHSQGAQGRSFSSDQIYREGIPCRRGDCSCGRPKIGKSWLALDWAIAVARGGFCFGDVHCTEGDVLYHHWQYAAGSFSSPRPARRSTTRKPRRVP